MENNEWEKYYKKTPPENIPWNRAQLDYFEKIVNKTGIKAGSVLDLGCGTGNMSVFLAKKGYKVTGVDISKTALDYAKQKSKKEGVNIEFIVADATDLSFLENRKFDLVIDWANLHGIPENKRDKYIYEITKHTMKSSKLILRCFGRHEGGKNKVKRPVGDIGLFTKDDIKKIYGEYFEIFGHNTTKSGTLNAPSAFFYEFLMERL